MNKNKTTKSHQLPRPPDRLDQIMEESRERAKAKGYVFTGDLSAPECRELAVRLVKKLAGV